MSLRTILAANVRAWRERRGLSQAEAARRAGWTSNAQWGRIEAGERDVQLSTLEGVVKALDRPAHLLLSPHDRTGSTSVDADTRAAIREEYEQGEDVPGLAGRYGVSASWVYSACADLTRPHPARLLTDDTARVIRAAGAADGWRNAADLAAEYGVSPEVVRSIWDGQTYRTAGGPLRGADRPGRGCPGADTLRPLVDAGMTAEEMAEHLSRSPATIYRWLREAGLWDEYRDRR